MKFYTALLEILKSKLFLAFAMFLFLFLFHGILKAKAATYYVSPTGSNSNSGTTLLAPWQTLEHAASQITGGDDVFVRAGTYDLASTLNLSFKTGTLANPTTFQPYNNETVVIDGKNLTLSDDQAIVLIGGSKYLYFQGFEVTDSRATPQGRGISLFDNDTAGDYIYLLNNKIHNTKMQGINIVGEYIYVEGNEIYDTCMVNENQALNSGTSESGGWPVAVSTFYEWGTAELTTNVFIRNNHVHHNWGEGIAPIYAQNIEISGNTVNDNYSVNIYLADTQNVSVFNNHVYSADTSRDRTLPVGWGGHAMGIAFANEIFYNVGGGTPTLAATSNLLIYNNILSNNSRAINYFNDPLNTQSYNTYGDVKIFNNVIYRDAGFDNNAGYALNYYDVPAGYTQPFGDNEISNNIIYSGGTNLELGLNMHSSDLGYWTFSNNDWVNGIPSIGTHINSYSFDPLFVNPNVGSDTSGFRVFSNSQAVNAGLNTSAYPDFVGTSRDTSPNLGVFEALQVLPTPTPTSTPVPTASPTATISPSTSPTVAPSSIATIGATNTPTSTTQTPTATPIPSTVLADTGSNSVKITFISSALMGLLIVVVKGANKRRVIGLRAMRRR